MRYVDKMCVILKLGVRLGWGGPQSGLRARKKKFLAGMFIEEQKNTYSK